MSKKYTPKVTYIKVKPITPAATFKIKWVTLKELRKLYEH